MTAAGTVAEHAVPVIEPAMVHEALRHLDLQGVYLLSIENVRNLVCPASFDPGQHRNVTRLSVPEGDDKPAKYPVLFRAAPVPPGRGKTRPI